MIKFTFHIYLRLNDSIILKSNISGRSVCIYEEQSSECGLLLFEKASQSCAFPHRQSAKGAFYRVNSSSEAAFLSIRSIPTIA